MSKSIRYSNGLRLVVETMPSVHTLAMGIWVGAGSNFETPVNNGIAHFVEHMIFKGTDKLSAFEIADAFESMGAAVNAFTGKESTCYYAKCIDEFGSKCFGLLSHIFFDSAFDPVEIDKERGVVVEEYNMIEDSPEDLCSDLLAKAMYDTHPLGKGIIGELSNIKEFDRKAIIDFAAEFYTSKNIVVALAGNISLDTADKWMREFFLPNVVKTTTATKTDKAYTSCARHLDRFKDFEQCNFALGYPTVSFVNKNFNTQAIVNTILGGGMSSRLFQEIREKRGLAYSIYSGGASYSANGSLNIICNTNPKSYTEAKSAALEVMDSVVNDGITEQEFVRAKTQIKSAFVFGQENCQSMMISAGKLMLAADKDFDIAHKIAEMEAVTLDDCNAFVGKYLSGDCICSAYVGKKES